MYKKYSFYILKKLHKLNYKLNINFLSNNEENIKKYNSHMADFMHFKKKYISSINYYFNSDYTNNISKIVGILNANNINTKKIHIDIINEISDWLQTKYLNKKNNLVLSNKYIYDNVFVNVFLCRYKCIINKKEITNYKKDKLYFRKLIYGPGKIKQKYIYKYPINNKEFKILEPIYIKKNNRFNRDINKLSNTKIRSYISNKILHFLNK